MFLYKESILNSVKWTEEDRPVFLRVLHLITERKRLTYIRNILTGTLEYG